MEKFKSFCGIFALFSLGLAAGQTQVGKTFYHESISWILYNPITRTVEKTVDDTKDSSVKLKKKIERKYEDIKTQAKETTSSVIKDVKGFTSVNTKKDPKVFYNKSVKNGFVCEYYNSPKVKYSRCNKIASNDLIKNQN